MTIKANFPTIRPKLLLDFANSDQLDPRITFTRASSGTYFDKFGVLRTAANNVARFDHDPVTGQRLGLLIEASRANLLTYSEDFADAAWTKTRASITADAATALDQTMTGDKLIANTDNNTHFIGRNFTATANTAYALSVFAKAGEYNSVRIRFGKASAPLTRIGIIVDLTTGVITNSDASTPTSVTHRSAVNVGNGWYRIAIAGIFDTTSTDGAVRIEMLDNSGSFSFAGDGTSGIFIWGAQLEVGAFPTSYIKTVASSVTRAADAAGMFGGNFSSWYRQDEGSFVAAYSRNSDRAGGNQIPFIVSDGTGANIIAITDSANGASDRVLIATNNANQMNTGSVNYTANQLLIRSIGYKVDDCATAVNGGTLTTDTTALIPVVNQLTIGYAPYFASSRLNGHIRKLAYYDERLTNAQLQALTS
jgi:hypothetical protein